MAVNAIELWNQKRARFQRVAKESGWIFIGQVASILGSLVLVRVLTEYLGPAEYGELALGLTAVALVNQVVMGGIIAGVGRFYSIAKENDCLESYMQASRRLLAYAALVVVVLAIILVGTLAAIGYDQWIGLSLAVLIFSIVSSYNSALNGVQNAARQRAIVALHNGMNSWLKIGLAVLMILWMGAASTTVVLGYVVSALVVSISQLIFLRRTIGRHLETLCYESQENWTQRIWKFSWPFSIWGVFTWSQQISDRWALELFTSTTEVGQYAVLFQLGYTPTILLTGMLVTLVGPILFQKTGAANDPERNAKVGSLVWRISFACLALSLIVFLSACLLHDWIFQLLVAEPFRGVSHFLPWVLLAGGLFATGQMLSLKLHALLATKALLTMKISTAIIGIGANVIGSYGYGMSGVVAALVIFSATYMIWTAYLSLNHEKFLP